MQAWHTRMVSCGLPVDLGLGHHAQSISLGDLDLSITLSLESHCGRVCNSSSNRFVRDPYPDTVRKSGILNSQLETA
jgi:hypothetical protein